MAEESHELDRGGEGPAAEVLYEIRHHAKRAISQDQSQPHVPMGGARGGWLSYLSAQGINQLKEKWDEFKRPRQSGKRMSLFVSPDSEHVAVAAGNQIIVLQKDDDYMEPCGVFVSSDRSTVFIHGAWSERGSILGVIDGMSTLYFIKPNGEEITRKTRSQLKLSAPIIDLIVVDDFNSKNSCLNGFCIFTADGIVHHIEVTKDPSTCIYPIPMPNNYLTEKSRFPCDVSCMDFHPKLSLVVLVCASSVSSKTRDITGFFSLYLLRITTSLGLEIMFCSPQFKGSFSLPKGYVGMLTSPKVVISPQGKHIATLDLTGCVNVYELDDKLDSLSLLSFAEGKNPNLSKESVPERKQNDIVDISWWADQILIVAKRSGIVTMYDILSGIKLMENSTAFSMAVVERVKHRQGYVFVLEATSFGDKMTTPEHMKSIDMKHINYHNDESYKQQDTGGCWQLMSFSQRSVSDMYSMLISNQDYQAALDFANRYWLDSDEVFKAQWLHSHQGAHEIQMILSNVKDQQYILSECVEKIGPTEEAAKALISYGLRITEQYIFSELDDSQCSSIWEFRMVRLQLLQYRDRLETYVGINMGRFSSQEYSKFRVMPLKEAAVSLAESGKIGALNLLFKRHPYSLSPNILAVLSAIPETIPVQSYGQLLPGRSPPSTIALRDEDWVECEKMVAFINKMQGRSQKIMQMSTENILKHSMGFVWPSVDELLAWYKNRARDIDILSGQLDNCLSLVEFACRKGILELQQFLEDISYLHQLIYLSVCDEDLNLSVVTWEQLSDYEKFKMMLKGVKEDTVVERLRATAIPFMHIRFRLVSLDSEERVKEDKYLISSEQRESFLIRWLKEIAAENKLDICLAVILCGCGDSLIDELFKNEAEIIETTLQCIYLCTLTNQWNKMASILSRLPRKTLRDKSFATGKDFSPRHSPETSRFSYGYSPFSKSERQLSPVSLHEVESTLENTDRHAEQLDVDVPVDKLVKRLKVAEGHVEAGRLLEYYQVPKTMSFFLSAQSDEKTVKQLLRLILSKFARRQPVRSDNDWANMWRDMQCLQEKAFPFLDLEYMLIEFCRGLLKAGKFSLARNYLKGTGSTALATEKAENLVIQAAREYFFAASSLACSEIWKARECLSLFPNSKSVQAETDVIDVLTIRLPSLGVTLLPMQFRQIRNPMEIISMVISSQTGAYLNVEELIEIAKLLGLRSQEDVVAVEEAVAREAAVAGDLQLAFDLCLVLARKGHGAIWDLCAAIARGPHLDNMDTSSRKHLLGFALSHCDAESIGELLHAWKDVDMHSQYDQLIASTGSNPPNFSVQGSSIISLPVHSVQEIYDLRESSEHGDGVACRNGDVNKVHLENIKDILSEVGQHISTEGGRDWVSLLRENRKLLLFAALELPWLLQLSRTEEYGKRAISGAKASRNHFVSIKTQALVTILYRLAGNDIAPSDDLITSLANSVMEPPVSEEEDILGCSLLLNLMDALHGVEIIEEQLKRREVYQEIYSIMNIGMAYSSLNNSCVECSTPDQRRKLLLHKFRERHTSLSSDEIDQIDKVQSTFWREWKTKLEVQKQLAEQARALEQIIPGTETARFLSGDVEYIKSVIFSFIDSAKLEKRPILREAVKLADTYGLHRIEVLLRFFGCALVSEHWENDDILAEIAEFREDIVSCPRGVIDMISSVVYPEIKGHNKLRLSYVYSILSACYLRIRRTKEPSLTTHQDRHLHILQSDQYYKILEQECRRISFIEELNFKNIAGLDDVNFDHFNEEICKNICASTVDSLADMVRNLTGIYTETQMKGLMSWNAVYKHHVLSLLASLESEVTSMSSGTTPEEMQDLIGKIELNYDICKKYFRFLIEEDRSCIIGQYFVLCMSFNSPGNLLDESSWKKYLVGLLNFWIKVADNIQDAEGNYASEELNFKSLSRCLHVFRRLVMKDEVLTSQGWSTISNYVRLGPVVGQGTDISLFYKAMIFSGCGFKSVADVFSEAELHLSSSDPDGKLKHLVDLFSSLMDKFLFDISRGSDCKENLHRLLSSLSRLDDNHIEDLKAVRNDIWGKLSTFSDNMQQENDIRVYALELMQAITGRNLRNLPVELAQEVEPWEAWDEPLCTKAIVGEGGFNVANSVTSTLVSLRSTQLVAAISPSIKITSEDLTTLDSALSCFLHLSESATSMSHLDVLQALLDEWEELFSSKLGEEKNTGLVEELNNWSSDEWDEGWESLPEELSKREGRQDSSISVRPLHACWMEIIRRLVALSKFGTVVELLDQSLQKPNGTLLDEDEAQGLFQLVVGANCIMALKIVLLLPHEGPRVRCLQIIEAKLEKEGITTALGANEYELVILALSSGIIGDIISNPAFGNVFSYLCYLVGHLARLCQEDMVRCRIDGSRTDRDKGLLFVRILFPGFISELVRAGQYLLAGLMVSQWMHMPASLHLINVVEASLRKFLEGQLIQAQPCNMGEPGVESCGSLVYSISSLRGKLGSLLQSALSALPIDTAK